MHTNPPMYNPMPGYHDDMGDPNHSNFSISYGAPNYSMPNYTTPNSGYPNYGPGNYAEDRNPMPRDRSQDYGPRKDHYGMKNQGQFQRDSHYHNRGKPMGNGRNGMNNSHGNKFQRMPNRNPRGHDSYHNNSGDYDYHDQKVLNQSKKISKPMMRNPGRRQDGPGSRSNYDNQHSYNPNYSKPFQRRPMRQESDQDSDKGTNPQMFFKTKLCPHLAEGGCTRGSNCNYAHTEEELRDTPNLKKTKLCQLFQMGKCNRGNMCSFAHGEQELRSTPEFYKTSICNGYLKGACRAGDNCRYAHGKEELRPNPRTESYSGYPPSGMPMHGAGPENNNNMSGFELSSYQSVDSGNVDMSKDPKNSRFVMNGNNMHSYINPMDSNPVEPTYLNNSYQGTNGVKSSPSKRNDNMSQNSYNTNNPKFNNYVPNNNNWDRNVPVNKPVNNQAEHPDNITFHSYSPEKLNALFTTPNENQNFLK